MSVFHHHSLSVKSLGFKVIEIRVAQITHTVLAIGRKKTPQGKFSDVTLNVHQYFQELMK